MNTRVVLLVHSMHHTPYLHVLIYAIESYSENVNLRINSLECLNYSSQSTLTCVLRASTATVYLLLRYRTGSTHHLVSWRRHVSGLAG